MYRNMIIKQALISVSDKTGIVEFAQELSRQVGNVAGFDGSY